jgi:uncharacterized membrane protein
MMIALLATAGEKHSRLMGFLGNLHPGIVHFPIALLATAALLELLQMVRRKEGPAPGSLPMVFIAALAAAPACLFGWFLSEIERTEGSTLELHKWMGIATAVVAAATAGAAFKSRSCGGALKIFRVSLFLGSGLVLTTGYLGGEMAMGSDHLVKWFRAEAPKKEEPRKEDSSKPLLKPSAFEAQIAPIIKASCIKCHNPGKKKGKLLLDTKANAMKGGENGPCIVPGKPDESSFYKLLVDTDPDVRMPEKEKDPLPKAQIELIRKWIEQGAEWPDGVTIK